MLSVHVRHNSEQRANPIALRVSFLAIMLTASLEEIKYVRFTGLKNVFKISPKESKMCDDVAFVRLKPRNGSLIAVVCEDNPNAPEDIPKNFSLSSCDGLKQLMSLRNEAQAKLLAPADDCSLFSNSVAKPKLKAKARLAHSERRSKRKECDALDVSLTIDGTAQNVSVIKPLHGQT